MAALWLMAPILGRALAQWHLRIPTLKCMRGLGTARLGLIALSLAALLSGGMSAAVAGTDGSSASEKTTPSVSKPAVALWPVPPNSGTGRRIVYSQKLMHVWLISAQNQVVKHYPVTGRADHPPAGNYRVFSKSPFSVSWDGRFYMRWMTRWYKGTTANVGFHSIPKTWSGVPIQSISDLGKPLGIGGCVRLAYYASKYLYDWARVGTVVKVVR